jgi:hypothetical protein
MKIILIFAFLFIITISDAHEFDYNEVAYIIERNDLDIDSKSIKGWIRIFNSRDKIYDYGYDISDYEREMMIKYFKELKNKKIKKYSRGMQ